MLKRSILLATSLAALLAGTTAIAQTPTNEELDLRMRAMESTMQTMLELLQAQQGGTATTAGATTTVAEETPAPVPAGYQMGGVYLDVFTRKLSGNEVDQMRDPSKLPNGPQGVPAGSVLIKAPTSFVWGSFGKEPSLATFRKADALVGVQWFGSFFVDAAGDHTFSIQLKRSEGNGVQSCRSVLRVNDKVVADALGYYRYGDEQVDTAQGTVPLAVGDYDFSLWTNCRRSQENGFDLISTTINLAAPGDRAPKPIPPERFGVQP